MNHDLYYYLIVVLGLVMIWQHAQLQFQQPIKVDSHRRYEILNDLDIVTLASKDTLKLGRSIYISTYILIYLLALFFWDNISDLLETERARTEDGALGTPEFLKSLVPDERAGRPLAVAATLMSLLAVGGQLSKYEEPVRRFAHRRAGIPRGIYRVARLLNTSNFRATKGSLPCPGMDRFKTRVRELKEEGCDLDRNTVALISSQLKRIDLISPAVIGPQFDHAFNFSEIDQLTPRIEKLREEVRQIDDSVKKIDKEHCSVSELRALSDEILKQENNLVAMFAVLYLNTRSFTLQNIPSPTRDVIKEISVRQKTFELSSIAWAAMITITVSAFFYLAAQRLSISYRDNDFSNFFNSSGMQFAAKWSIRSLIEHSILIISVAVVSVLRRQEKLDEDSWDMDFSINQPPIGQYLSNAIAPSMVGILLLIFVIQINGLLTQHSSGSEFVTVEKILRTTTLNYIYFIGSFIASIIISVGVYFMSDLHDRLSMEKTTRISLIAGGLYFLVILFMFETFHNFNQRLAITDTMKMSMFGILFLFLYARFIEIYEDPESGEKETDEEDGKLK